MPPIEPRIRITQPPAESIILPPLASNLPVDSVKERTRTKVKRLSEEEDRPGANEGALEGNVNEDAEEEAEVEAEIEVEAEVEAEEEEEEKSAPSQSAVSLQFTKAGKPLRRSPQADNTICKRLVTGQAYESRNVYKSIVRHIYSRANSGVPTLIDDLLQAGYAKGEIERAFMEIINYRSPDNPKDIEKNSQVRIEKMMRVKSIFTCILKDSLVIMIKKWEQGKYGQLSKANSEIYLEACKKFLAEVVKVLSGGGK